MIGKGTQFLSAFRHGLDLIQANIMIFLVPLFHKASGCVILVFRDFTIAFAGYKLIRLIVFVCGRFPLNCLFQDVSRRVIDILLDSVPFAVINSEELAFFVIFVVLTCPVDLACNNHARPGIEIFQAGQRILIFLRPKSFGAKLTVFRVVVILGDVIKQQPTQISGIFLIYAFCHLLHCCFLFPYPSCLFFFAMKVIVFHGHSSSCI